MNGEVTISKQMSFCYGHKLPGYSGKCQQSHGHNASVIVTVGGRDHNSYPTMVMDFKRLSAIMDPILEQLDHRDLTHFFDYPDFGDPDIENKSQPDTIEIPATAETICRWMANQIQAGLPEGTRLVRLQVSETPTSWAEWREKE